MNEETKVDDAASSMEAGRLAGAGAGAAETLTVPPTNVQSDAVAPVSTAPRGAAAMVTAAASRAATTARGATAAARSTTAAGWVAASTAARAKPMVLKKKVVIGIGILLALVLVLGVGLGVGLSSGSSSGGTAKAGAGNGTGGGTPVVPPPPVDKDGNKVEMPFVKGDNTVEMRFVLSGEVSDYDVDSQAVIKRVIAKAAKVMTATVSLVLTPGSINCHVSINTKTNRYKATTAKNTLAGGIFSSNGALETALAGGGLIEVTVVSFTAPSTKLSAVLMSLDTSPTIAEATPLITFAAPSTPAVLPAAGITRLKELADQTDGLPTTPFPEKDQVQCDPHCVSEQPVSPYKTGIDSCGIAIEFSLRGIDGKMCTGIVCLHTRLPLMPMRRILIAPLACLSGGNLQLGPHSRLRSPRFVGILSAR